MTKTKAIVFGCYVNGLSIIRSLGRKGIPVVAVDYDKNTIGLYSKYAHESIIAPDPKVSSEKFLSFLFDNANKWKNGILIPTDDYVLDILSKNKKELSSYYTIPVPDWEITKNIVNKERTYEIAKELNIPIPKTFFPDSMEYLKTQKEEFEYPCILKPLIGHKFINKFKTKLYKINTFEELELKFKLAYETGYDMMVQEIIPGADDQIYVYGSYYDLNNKPLAEFTGRKLRQIPPTFGVTRVIESTYTDKVIDLSRRLLRKLSYTGLCDVEFKKDPRDNKYKLIEVNARSGMWMGLSIESGVNLPWIMYKDLVDHKKVEVNGYDVGVKWIHIRDDLEAIIRYHKQENLKAMEYLSPYLHKKTYAVFALDDLKPFIREWQDMPIRVFQHIWRS